MSKSYDRTSGDESGCRQKIDSIIKKELTVFFKKNMNDHRVINRLREKYGDRDTVHAVFEAYKERQHYIERRAKKFKQLIMSHYSDRALTSSELIRKAKKYQEKLNLNDSEFDMFINLVMSEKNVENEMFSLPATKMSKTLGFSQALLVTGDTLNVAVDEENIVQDILRMYGETKSLHGQIVLQSLSYEDVGDEAINGKICASKHNYYHFVHPVVAALFLPKIKYLDEQMLIANLGYIIHCKKHGLPIMTQPDVELYYNLIRDPNEHVCDSDSAIKDLRNRYFLQTKLWDSVVNLRQGKYYQDNLTDFLTAVDQCRSSIYDAPDLTYVKDEGAILRRLLAAFSVRPTLVATTRLWGMMGTNPYNLAVGALSSAGITRLTTVPMATLRLPLSYTGAQDAVELSEALSQPQWFVENNMIIPKKQEIIHSRDLLFFYVGRRFKSIQISRLNNPYNFSSLPMTVAGWEQLNETPVNFNRFYPLNNEFYALRSVVVVTKQQMNDQTFVSGCTSYVSKLGNSDFDSADNAEAATNNASWFHYDPLTSGREASKGNSGVSTIANAGAWNSIESNIKTLGTIFMYQKINKQHNLSGFAVPGSN